MEGHRAKDGGPWDPGGRSIGRDTCAGLHQQKLQTILAFSLLVAKSEEEKSLKRSFVTANLEGKQLQLTVLFCSIALLVVGLHD